MLSTEALVDFGETLKRNGFDVTSYELIAAQRALTCLLGNERLPADPHQLAPYLAPIFCSSAESQQEFHSLFRDWAGVRFPVAAKPTPEVPQATAPPEIAAPPPKRSRRWLVIAAIVLAGLAAIGFELGRERQLEVRVTSEDGLLKQAQVFSSPAAAPSIAVPGQPLQVPYRRWSVPFTLEVTAAGYEPVRRTVTAPVPQVASIELWPLKADEPAPPPEAAAPPPLVDTSTDTRTFVAARPLNIVGLACFLLILLTWWYWNVRRRQAWLQRQPAAGDEAERRLRAGHGEVRAALHGVLQKASRELRRRRSVASRELDVDATLAATLRGGGLVSPVFESRVEPEYVVLIDRAALSDQFARLASEIVEGFHDQSVSVQRFFFDRDPSRCRHAPLKRGAPDFGAQDLSQLFARFSDRQLLLFTDGAGFLDPYLGTPAAWVARVLEWRRPIVLTPSPVERWGKAEWMMEQQGFAVLPLDRIGLRALGELARRRDGKSFLPQAAPSVGQPKYIRDTDRLLDHETPSAEFLDGVMTALRNDLEPATFTWLCALAVYPELHWSLTLRVGASICPKPGEMPERLAALSRLPWLRAGYMPDWLRTALLAELPETERQRIRVLLEAFLDEVRADAAGGDDLRIALGGGAHQASATRFIRGLLGRESEVAAPNAPSQERVFLRFMSGKRARLAVKATTGLQTLLYREGAALGGLRPQVIVAMAVVGVMLLAWIFPPFERETEVVAITKPPVVTAQKEPAPVPPLEQPPVAEAPPPQPPVPAAAEKAATPPTAETKVEVAAAKPAEVSAPAAPVDTATAIERDFWVTARDSNRLEDLQAYLEKFPNGTFASLARVRIAGPRPQPAAATQRPELAAQTPTVAPTPPTAQAVPGTALGRRVALLIGINAYSTHPLRNAANDAKDLADALKEIGFTVIVRENARRRDMIEAIREFDKALDGADTALFFFAGHAMQFKDRNYLIPIDAAMGSEEDVTFFSVDVSQVFDRMEKSRTRFNFLILDACRDNPFSAIFKVTQAGLAQMSAPSGTLVAYSTTPGSVAPDGFGRNGIYTKHILQNIKVPDLPAEIMFKRVREGVERETRRLQTPWDSSSLKGDFAFVSSSPPSARPTGADGLPGREVSPGIREVVFADGAIYRGAMRGSRYHGKGEYVSKSFKYEGEFSDGLKQGRGTYVWENGDRYEGTFTADRADGRGKYQFANGDSYEGDVKAGVIIGRGVYVAKSGDVFEGSFVNGKPHGVGVYRFATGDRYEGEMDQGRLQGRGRYVNKNGDKIEAPFVDGKPQGRGVYYFSNGDRYEGELRAGVISGIGVYNYRSGLKYEGEVRQDRPQGKGVLWFLDGSRFEGIFENGLARAKGEIIRRDNTRAPAEIVDGNVKLL